MLILKIIGVVALIVVAIVVVGVIWFWRAVVKEAATPPFPPCRVNLEPEEHPTWRNEGQIMKYAAEFRAAGFEQVGVFTIPEMGGLHLLAFVHAAERFYACIYDHQQVPPWFDIFAEFADQTELTGSNTQLGDTMDRRPGDIKVAMKDSSVKEVFNALREHPKAAERLAVARESFAETFKRQYARSMNWTMRKGGVSREEIRRQMQQDKQELTDEQFEEVCKEVRASYVQQLQQGCIAQYLDESKIPLVDWERMQHRAFAVPETLDSKELVELIDTTGYLDEEQRHALSKMEVTTGTDAIETIQKIITQNVGGLGLQRIAEISEPVRAWIVLLPDPNAPAPAKLAA